MEWVVLATIFFAMMILLIFLLPGIIGAPYVPSEQKDLETAFTKLRKIGKKDFVVDLGAGDGIVLKAAAAHGAKALGVEINPILTIWTRFQLRKIENAQIKCGDMYKFELPSETTIVYAYANNFTIPRLFKRTQDEAKRLGKTLYLISNAFDQKDIKPKKHIDPYYLYEIKP
ncbi:methyltransferase domain-containing protein [Candidatus Saccharibacteria bacterium]|nr:methyltransferase domain-containing protein [Candidatus Saccharibacteria bacterium]